MMLRLKISSSQEMLLNALSNLTSRTHTREQLSTKTTLLQKMQLREVVVHNPQRQEES